MLKAGRELDIEIAKKVLGFTMKPVGPDCDGENAGEFLCPPGQDKSIYSVLPLKGSIPDGYFVRNYSTCLTEAMPLLTRYKRKYRIQIDMFPDPIKRMVTVNFLKDLGSGLWACVASGQGSEIPEAICLSLLELVAGE